MKTVLIIILGVLGMGGMVGLDAFISRDLKKPAKNKKRTNESKDNSNEKDEDHLYDRAGK